MIVSPVARAATRSWGGSRIAVWSTAALARRERLSLAVLITASAAIRTVVALGRPSPLYYPDEYIYSALARSIAGTGLPSIRGASAHFPALLGPYLMAPAWLIHDVDVAYRVALGWGSLWFSLAALPAYALARRVGLTSSRALFVAAVALLVPDAAFTTTLLSEPFAYPVFLTTMLVAVDTIASPTRRRQVLLLGLMLALCLLRLQFVVFPFVYLAAALACIRLSPRTLGRQQPLVLGALALVAAVALSAGVRRVAGVYAGITAMHLPTLALARWFGLDLFVIAVASGWLIVPGAVAGLAQALRDAVSHRKAFAALTVTVTATLMAQAAFFGANEGRSHERYVFYVAPLLAIAFAGRDRRAGIGIEKTVAYATGGAAILVPLASGMHAASDDQAPTLLGLVTLSGGSNAGTLVWATALAVLAVGVGLGVVGRRLVPAAALAVLAAVGAAAALSLVGFGTALGARLNVSTDIPRFHTPPGSAIVTSQVTNRFLLMKTLFWNPNVTRVLVVGGGPAADGYAATDVGLGPNGLVDRRGRRVRGPFVVDTDTTQAAPAAGPPRAFLFGLNTVDHYLETVSWLDVAAGKRALDVRLRLVSTSGTKRMALACGRDLHVVSVGDRPTSVSVPVPSGRARTCRISLIGGAAVVHRGRTVSVRGQLTVRFAA